MRHRIDKTGLWIRNGIPHIYTESDPEFEKRLDPDTGYQGADCSILQQNNRIFLINKVLFC